jgi:hypothetical protein
MWLYEKLFKVKTEIRIKKIIPCETVAGDISKNSRNIP